MECESTLDTQNKHLVNILTRVRVRIQLAKPTGCTRYATIPRGFCTFFARRNAGGSSGVREKRAHARPARPGPHVSFLSGAGPSVTIPCPQTLHFLAMPLCFSLKRGPDQPKPGSPERKENHFIPPFFFSRKHRRQKIFRAGTNRFTGREPETPRSPPTPCGDGGGGTKRSRSRGHCRRGARGVSERETLLEAAGGGRGRGGERTA
jgi:hypothetical protein